MELIIKFSFFIALCNNNLNYETAMRLHHIAATDIKNSVAYFKPLKML